MPAIPTCVGTGRSGSPRRRTASPGLQPVLRAVRRTRGNTPARQSKGCRSGDTRAHRASPSRSRLRGLSSGRRQCAERLRAGLGRDGGAAHAAELRVGRERAAALGARNDRRHCRSGPPAVGTEVGAPDERCAAGTARGRSGATHGHRCSEKRLELVQPVVQSHQVLAPVHQQVLAKLIAAEHLQHQAAEIAQTVLPYLEERSALAPQDAGMRERPAWRLGFDGTGNPLLVGAAEASKQVRPRHAHQSNSALFPPKASEPGPERACVRVRGRTRGRGRSRRLPRGSRPR